MSNANKKRLFIDLTKSINPSKYRRTSSSGLNSDSGSLQYSTSSSISSELALDGNSIKGSPTPSMTDNSSLISDDLASVKSCCDSNKTYLESRSSISTISLSSSDEADKPPQTSQYSNSPSNESLNSNKRVTRNTSKVMENTSLMSNQSMASLINNNSGDNAQCVNRKKCLWNECKFTVDASKSNDELIEHVKIKHILTQNKRKKYHCLWKDCSVYDKPSSSFIWLERHVIDHIDLRPFSCLFTGCNRKFRTEAELLKHCGLHCNTNASSTSTNNSLTAQLNNINGIETSPGKTRQQKHNILNSAKLALIHNIKHKNKSSSQLNELNPNTDNSEIGSDRNGKRKFNGKAKSSTNLMNGNHTNGTNGSTNGSTRFQNYSQILKALTKKRKTTDFNKKKFKKAQFKDFFDACSLKVVDDKLDQLSFKSGTCTFQANIVGSCVNMSTGVETYEVEWHPKNYIENEWIEKDKLVLTKTVDVKDMFKRNKINHDKNPLYARHRFRKNRRK